MNSMQQKKRRGFTLLETTLVLLIIALIMAGAIRYYQIVQSSTRVNSAVTMINAVYSASAQWYESHGNFLGPNNSVINLIPDYVRRGWLPPNFSVGTKRINPWGGDVTAQAVSETDNQRIRIQLTEVPEGACNDLQEKFFMVAAWLKNTKPTCNASKKTFDVVISMTDQT